MTNVLYYGLGIAKISLKNLYQFLVQGTVYFPCDMSVKSNFTFDFIFLMHKGSEKRFPFFVSPKSKMAVK